MHISVSLRENSKLSVLSISNILNLAQEVSQYYLSDIKIDPFMFLIMKKIRIGLALFCYNCIGLRGKIVWFKWNASPHLRVHVYIMTTFAVMNFCFVINHTSAEGL